MHYHDSGIEGTLEPYMVISKTSSKFLKWDKWTPTNKNNNNNIYIYIYIYNIYINN